MWRTLPLLLLLLLLPGLRPLGAEETGETQGGAPMAYAVSFQGLEEHGELAGVLREHAVTVTRQNDPPVSRFLLVRRVNRDRELLINALKSQGHFDGHVGVGILGESPPFEVMFQVDPGPRYRFAGVQARVSPAGSPFKPPAWEKLGIVEGEPALSDVIVQAEAALVQNALEQGFPRAKAGKRRVVRDKERHTIRVEFALESGERVRLGGLRVRGAEGVDEAFLLRRLPWEEGVVFHPKRLEEARAAFTETGLFSMVRLKMAEKPDERGYWPLEVELTERRHRTWRGGGGFSTDKGVVVNGGWEHRNLGHAGERLRAEATGGKGSLLLKGGYDIPDFLDRGQKLRFSGKIEQATEQAFENLSTEWMAGISRPLFVPWAELSLTCNYRLSDVLELSTGDKKSYSVASLPLGLTLDRANDPLDATEGWRFATEIAKMQAVTGKSVTYTRLHTRGSIYYTPPALSRLVLAGRGELAAAFGAERDDIPADNRLYAGGGGTVRGYGQQLASPLDATGKPLGGRSLLATSLEARLRLTPAIGMVAFIDSGSAFIPTFPKPDAQLLHGAGAGLRYQTPVGPLRLDVAVPLEKRPEIDAPYQLYMSIGQAF